MPLSTYYGADHFWGQLRFNPTVTLREAVQNNSQTWATEGWEAILRGHHLRYPFPITIVPSDIDSPSLGLVHVWLQWTPAWVSDQNISRALMAKPKTTGRWVWGTYMLWQWLGWNVSQMEPLVKSCFVFLHDSHANRNKNMFLCAFLSKSLFSVPYVLILAVWEFT